MIENLVPFRQIFPVISSLKLQERIAQSAVDLLKTHVQMVVSIRTSLQATTKEAIFPTKGLECDACTRRDEALSLVFAPLLIFPCTRLFSVSLTEM
jgi:hypothetical protein